MPSNWSDLPSEIHKLVFDHMFASYDLDLNDHTSSYPWTDLELVGRQFRNEVRESVRHQGPKVLRITGTMAQVFNFARTYSLDRVKSVKWTQDVRNFDMAVDMATDGDMQAWLAGEVAVWAAFRSPLAAGQVSGRVVNRLFGNTVDYWTGESDWFEEYEVVVKVTL